MSTSQLTIPVPWRSLIKNKNAYRGYMPIGLPQHRPPNRIKPWWKVIGKPRVTLYPKERIEGFSDEPEYPPLNDASPRGLKTQVRLDWYERLKEIPTAELKMHEIGRHCDHFVALINNWLPAYDSLPMTQYMTRTYLLNKLPESYTTSIDHNVSNESDIIEQVKTILTNQIILSKYDSIKGRPGFVSKSIHDPVRNRHFSDMFLQSLISSLRAYLGVEKNSQLLDYQYDSSPAIRSWWYHSGLPPGNNKVFYKSRKDADGNINQMIQMDGSSSLNIRSDSLIEPIVSLTDPLVTDTSKIKPLPYKLRHYGAQYKFKRPVSLAGFWPHSSTEFTFPHTCFLSTDSLKGRDLHISHKVRAKDDDETFLNAQAIMTAFGWLNSLSMYHGFTPFQELEYPFTCQVVTTDGQNWLFNVYQLNTHAFHRDLKLEGRNNVCWSSGVMKLYDGYHGGQLIGLNDAVIKMIVRFFTQQTNPGYTSQLNLHPYLSEDGRNDEDKEKTRLELRRQFEQRKNEYLLHDWKVPLFEHIFFRSPVGRNRIKHMKARWHIPKPKYPRIFE